MTAAMNRRNQLTIHELDERVEKAIRELAQSERISMSEAGHRLLVKGAGLSAPAEPRLGKIGHSLDYLFGNWTKEEADDFNEAIRWFDRIDPEMWE